MAQTSVCNRCGSRVAAGETNGGRAYYSCSCGKRWSGRAFHGNDTSHAGEGAIVGGIFGLAVGGPLGALIGAGLGAAAGSPDACGCLVCGGTGYSTGRQGNITMYQCSSCLRTWTRRRRS